MGRRALVLVVALLLGAVAAFAIYRFLTGVEADVLEGQEQITVFRAVQPLAEGTQGSFVLQSGATLYVESFEELEDLPTGAIQSAEELTAVLTGRVAAGPIAGNSVLTRDQWVLATVQITPLAELIPEGKQAITISADQITGVNGFVEAGDRINVIVTLDIEFRLTALAEQTPDFGIPVEPPPGEEETPTDEEVATVTYTRYVLQGLPVIAVGRDIRTTEDAPISITVDGEAAAAQEGEAAVDAGNSTVFTLEVTPEQAERLVFAQQSGALYFTLVPIDFVEVATLGVTIETLFEGDLVEDIFGN